MPEYDFACATCGGPCIRAYKFCPWCSTEIRPVPVKTRYSNGRRFTVESVRKLLDPIIQMNGYVWVADKIGIDESAIRHPLNKQATISERVLDKWLTPLGLTNALLDGTLKELEPPAEKYYEE